MSTFKRKSYIFDKLEEKSEILIKTLFKAIKKDALRKEGKHLVSVCLVQIFFLRRY